MNDDSKPPSVVAVSDVTSTTTGLSLMSDETPLDEVHNALKKAIDSCTTLDDYESVVKHDRFRDCLARLQKAQAGKDPEEWAKEWGTARASEKPDAWVMSLDKDRRTALDLLYALCNQCLGNKDKVPKEELVSGEGMVRRFHYQINDIVTLCLVMDRARALYGLHDNFPMHNRFGKSWFAEQHTELMKGIGAISQDFIEGHGHPMNRRFLWLFDIVKKTIPDSPMLLRSLWIKPALSPLIEYSKRVKGAAKECDVVVVFDNGNDGAVDYFCGPRVSSVVDSSGEQDEYGAEASIEAYRERVANFSQKTTPEEQKEVLSKALGEQWENAPTVKMELNQARVKNILAGFDVMATKMDVDGTTEETKMDVDVATERIRGGGNFFPFSLFARETDDKATDTTFHESDDVLDIPTPLTDRIAATNYKCFKKIIDSRVQETLNQWKQGNRDIEGVPAYSADLGELRDVAFTVLINEILALVAEKPGDIELKHEFVKKIESKLWSVMVPVETLAKAALIAVTPSSAVRDAIQAAVTEKSGGAGFMLTRGTEETFWSEWLPATKENGWQVSCCGVAVSSSQFALGLFGVADAKRNTKHLGIKSVVVCYDTETLLFPEVAKEIDNIAVEAQAAFHSLKHLGH